MLTPISTPGAADRYMFSCYRCYPLGLRTLLQGLDATCSLLDVLVYAPTILWLPGQRKKWEYFENRVQIKNKNICLTLTNSVCKLQHYSALL